MHERQRTQPAAPAAAERHPRRPAEPAGALPAGLAPPHPTAATARQAAVARLQRQAGNAAVQQSLVQRGGPDAGTPAAPEPPRLPATTYGGGMSNFDVTYVPGDPLPHEGTFTVTMRVYVELIDFSRAIMRRPEFRRYFRQHPLTREQRADFAWPTERAERDRLRAEHGRQFQRAVDAAWSGRFRFHLSSPGVAEYRCGVAVRVELTDDPAQAHHRLRIQKIPRGVAARFRSFVGDGGATLDQRDTTETLSGIDRSLDYVRQVGPFDHDSSTITSGVETQLQAVERDLRRIVPLRAGAPHEDWVVYYTGRATSPGSEAYNNRLSQDRARAVEQRVSADLGWPDQRQARPAGERHATTDPRFRRVDVQVVNLGRSSPDLVGNVAAHEAGHMFGLGDEYVDEAPTTDAVPKFLGDQPSHHADVARLMGQEAADELLVQESSGSIMASGGEVRRGHYVYFLEALNRITGHSWTIE